MKKLTLLSLLVLFVGRINAQTEIKISPAALLFEVVAISVETAVTSSIGMEADAIFGQEDFRFNINGKFYFNPKSRIDGFHVGAFLGNVGDTESVGLGFLVGYKILSKKRLLFEAGLGLGRSFDDGIVGYGKLHLGYRFGKGKTSPMPNESR